MPYIFNICINDFLDNSSLKKNLKTHAKEKPHQCDYCNKASLRKDYLISHMRRHTEEKPYKCNQCD